MENSSKALLIAGGVLIAVLILSLFVYLYLTMHSFSNEYNSNINSQKIHAFNAQFEVYNGREDLTIQDIVTVANMADEYNKKNNLLSADNSNFEHDQYILVEITAPHEYMNNLSARVKFEYMFNIYIKHIFKTDSIGYNKDTGKVNRIRFSGQTNI